MCVHEAAHGFWCTVVWRPRRKSADKNSNLCLLNGSRWENEDFTIHECNSQCVEAKTVKVMKCMWTCVCVCPIPLWAAIANNVCLACARFPPACICFDLYVCTLKHTLFVFVTRVCVCSQAGRQESTAGWWPNSAGLNIKEVDCCKGFSQSYSEMTTVTHTHAHKRTHTQTHTHAQLMRDREREREGRRKGNKCKNSRVGWRETRTARCRLMAKTRHETEAVVSTSPFIL